MIFDSGTTFLLAGSVSTASSVSLALDRYYLDGTAETTFGVEGTVSYELVSGMFLHIQPDGKILVAGYRQGMFETKVGVARFTPGMATSIQEASELPWLLAFPNPTTDRIQLDLPTHSAPWEVRIHDAHGKEVRNQWLGATVRAELLVQDLAPGAYHLLLSAGDQRFRAAFVKMP